MNKAKEMRMAGNAAMEQNNYEKAIGSYTEALLASNKFEEQKTLHYSMRSHAYLQSAMASGDNSEADAKLQLALQDANEVIKTQPTWWKGYVQAGSVYKHRKEWNCAIDSFNEALALKPDMTEVKNCRDECRWNEMRAEMGGNFMSHGLKEEIEIHNELHGTQLNIDSITNKFEKLMATEFSGIRYFKGIEGSQYTDKEIGLLQEAVEAGSTEAMVQLGVLHMEGKGVEGNVKKAAKLFKKAAKVQPKDKNILGGELDATTHAQFYTGLCFQDGTGSPLDYCQARRWYKKASNGGHAKAANNVAILYAEGLGGEKSLVKAKQFFRLSASRGNRTAMESLAWMLLMEKDLVQAESWYVRALEAGNVHSIQKKDNFYKVLREMSEMNIRPPSSETNDDANLIEAIERVTENKESIATSAELAASPVARYWNNFGEIQRRAKIGHPFARTLVISMSYFAEGVNYLKQLHSTTMSAEDVVFTADKCIYSLAHSIQLTEIISYYEFSELNRLVDICKARISHQKPDLDLAARIVYCFMTVWNDGSFSHDCCQKYSHEVFFFKMQALHFAHKQNFEASLKACDDGLQKFPTDGYLLYNKANGMNMIKSYRKEQVIAAFKEFIKHAPFDEPLVPEAYYQIGFYTLGDEQNVYYKKGLEVEQKMIPCFLPYNTQMKSLLKLMVTATQVKNEQPEATTKTVEPNLQSSVAVNNLQLTNPARIQLVKRHRETLQNLFEVSRTTNFSVKLRMKPQKEEKLTECPDHFKAITLRDMDPHKDAVYKKRFINVLISEDPMFGLLRDIHVIVRDDNDDCINCSFNHLDHFDETVRQALSFGSKITVLNPHYLLGTDGSVSLTVDHPKTIIYQTAGKDNPICRYCWKENASHRCGNCKRAMYCNRSCQIDDWKIMKHKRICGLKYFDSL